MKPTIKRWVLDICIAVLAGTIVSVAYYFFQNSNEFAPGGVGGLATITYYLTDYKVSWAILMLAFNLPIFLLVTVFVNKKLGIILMIYITVQSLGTELFEALGWKPLFDVEQGFEHTLAEGSAGSHSSSKQ